MYIRFALFLAGFALVFVLLTYLLHRFIGSLKIVKYIPAIWALFMAIYFFYLSKTVKSGFQDLADAIFAAMFFSGFLSGLISAVVIDFKYPKRNE